LKGVCVLFSQTAVGGNFKQKTMKATITTFFLVLFSTLSFSQSVNDLDLKNGFRHFKLGSSSSQIQNIVKRESKVDNSLNVVSYDYVGNDIKTIFGVNVYGLSLSFFNNKLFSIRVSFGDFDGNDFTSEEYERIKNTLQELYGSDWITPTKNKNVISGAIWDGKKVCLELLRTNFNTNKTDPKDFFISGYMNVFDKKIMNEVYKNQF